MKFTRMLNVVDAHADGESGKLVVGSVGPEPGETMFDKTGASLRLQHPAAGFMPKQATDRGRDPGKMKP